MTEQQRVLRFLPTEYGTHMGMPPNTDVPVTEAGPLEPLEDVRAFVAGLPGGAVAVGTGRFGWRVLPRLGAEPDMTLGTIEYVKDAAKVFTAVNTGRPDLATVIAALEAKGAHWLAAQLADLIVQLGAKSEWSMEDNFSTTESIAAMAAEVGLPDATDQDPQALAFWTAIAEAEGWEHDELTPEVIAFVEAGSIRGGVETRITYRNDEENKEEER